MEEAIKKWKVMNDPNKGDWIIFCGFRPRMYCRPVQRPNLYNGPTFTTFERTKDCIEWLKKEGYVGYVEWRGNEGYVVPPRKE